MAAPSNVRTVSAREAAEDAVPVGNTRPARALGLPYPLAIAVGMAGYLIQTNVASFSGSSLRGFAWAVAICGPVWFLVAVLVRNDPFGAHVALAWVRTCAILRDPLGFGAPSLSPLPGRPVARRRRP